MLNIAEGSGKFSKPDRRSFYVIARASAFDSVAILDILHDKEKLSLNDLNALLLKADEPSRMLYAKIKNPSAPKNTKN